MSDLVKTIAFAFRRKGADALVGTDLRYLLAFDLRWFAPEDAKKAVQRAIETGLLREEGDMLRPTFDVNKVEIAMNFRPTNLALEEEAPVALPPATPPLAQAPQVGDQKAPDLERASEEERRKRGLLVSIEVARLIVRRRVGDDVTADAAAKEKALLSSDAPTRT